MTEIEQLQKDIAALKEARVACERLGWQKGPSFDLVLLDATNKLAMLEAEAAAKADPWEETKQELRRHIENRVAAGLPVDRAANYTIYLEQRVAELEADNARLERSVAGYKTAGDHTADLMRYMLDRKEVISKPAGYEAINEMQRLDARIAELGAELAKRPVVYCMKNNLTGIYGKHFGLDRIALFDIENPEVLAEWHSEPYTGEQS